MSYNLTLISSKQSPGLTKEHFDNVIQICTWHDIQTIDNNINWLDKNKAGQITISAPPPMKTIELIRSALNNDKIDCLIVNNNFSARLLVADMESTIIPNEMLDDLGEFLDIGEQIKSITERAMNGEIDFYQSVRERIALLKGAKTSTLDKMRDDLEPNPGAKTFVGTLKNNGVTCVLATGGFTYFSEHIAKICGFDEHHANELGIENAALTGKVIDPIFGPEGKLEVMQAKAEELGIGLEQCISIGDGANDLPMNEASGFGIGYHPKPAVKERLPNCIIHGDFTAALFAIGYTPDMFLEHEQKIQPYPDDGMTPC